MAQFFGTFLVVPFIFRLSCIFHFRSSRLSVVPFLQNHTKAKNSDTQILGFASLFSHSARHSGRAD